MHAVDLAATVDGNLRDGGRTPARVIGWVLDVTLDHRYVLAGDDLLRVYLLPSLEISLHVFDHDLVTAGEHLPVGEGEHEVL